MKKIILSTIAIFSLIGLTFAYADEFKIPFDPEYLIDHWLDVKLVPTDDGGVDVTVTHTSLFHFTNLFQVPEQIIVQVVDDTGSIIDATAMTIVSSAEEIIEPEPEPTEAEKLGISEESMARIEEKRAELEKLYEEAVTCKAYGTEGNSMFQSYLEEKISAEKVAFKNLPLNSQEKELIKAHEACRVFFEVAVHISNDAEMLEKFKAQQQAEIDEINRLKALETTTDYTDPITEEDIAETIETAEETLIKYPDFYKNPYGDCEPAGSERCQNRGGFSFDASGNIVGAECGIRPSETGVPTLDCPLKDYNALISSAISAEENYSEVEKIVCDKYLSQYQNLVERIIAGDETAELPHWLQHCEVR